LGNNLSAANGWLTRAEHLLEGTEENRGHGWLAIIRAFQAALTGENDRVLEYAGRAREIGVRLGDRDLDVYALSCQGVALLAKGDLKEGLAAVEEATAAAVGGELDPATAGGVCCATIEACAAMGDWTRAAEWTEAQDRWCRREHISGFPGMCRVYRSEIKRLRGSWLEAEAEARRATEELQGFIPAAVGLALYQIAEIRLRRGDLPAAEEALESVHALGGDVEPAMALLRLAQGNVQEAAGSIRRGLAEQPGRISWRATPNTDVSRLNLLPTQVEIAIAAGDLPTARAAADELTVLAEKFATLAARANARSAVGAVTLAEGRAAEAIGPLRDAIDLWAQFDAPYDVARNRLLLGEAYLADGAADQAAVEFRTARAAFERLGATPDGRRAEQRLATLESPASEQLSGGRSLSGREERVARTFMFTDIVDSTRLAEMLGDDAWNDLLRWHNQAIRSAVAEHGGEEVKTVGDGFFVAFPDTDEAIDAAKAVLRKLIEHRRSHGFAPALRIGLHRAEANRVGLDYLGSGVNVAARIGAAASSGEVLASTATLATSRRPPAMSQVREIELKGVSGPVEVASIDWR
jgi:class 3 adenylate cyclase